MRPVGQASVEIWGATDAVDGASVQVRLRARGSGRARGLAVAPAVGGHFYAKAVIPRSLRGRRLAVSARVAR